MGTEGTNGVPWIEPGNVSGREPEPERAPGKGLGKGREKGVGLVSQKWRMPVHRATCFLSGGGHK